MDHEVIFLPKPKELGGARVHPVLRPVRGEALECAGRDVGCSGHLGEGRVGGKLSWLRREAEAMLRGAEKQRADALTEAKALIEGARAEANLLIRRRRR